MEELSKLSGVKKLIDLAVEEDLCLGDPTTELSVSSDIYGNAKIVARSPLVFCGGEIAKFILDSYGKELSCSVETPDGEEVFAGTTLINVSGPLAEILPLERVTLNFLQRLSGVASNARRIVSLSKTLNILDTRKTTPGWRALDKYAIRCGGAANHRHNLGDMILVKDNHIDANGGDLKKTLERIFSKKAQYIPVEVEVRDLEEVKQALEFNVNALLFDNMDDQVISDALQTVRAAKPDVQCEISGGVTPERFKKLEQLGVTLVSLGSLTTNICFVDIAMDIASVNDS